MNTYCDLIVNTDENYGAMIKALHDSGGDGRHGDHPHRRPRRDGRLAPRGRQGPDDLRRAAADAALDLVAEALQAPGRAHAARWPRRSTSSPPASSSPGVERPGRALPVAARPLARARGRGPRGRAGKDFTVSTCDEVWSPQDFAGVGKPWKRHVRAALSGRFKVARYVAMSGKPQTRDPRRPGVRALRPQRGSLRAAQPRRATRPTSRCSTTCSRGCASSRTSASSPVEVPALRRRLADRAAAARPDRAARDTARRRRAAARRRSRASPAPTSSCPFGDPHLERRDLRGRRRRARCRRPPTRRARMAEARARQRAAMLCELGPAAAGRRGDERHRPAAGSSRGALGEPRSPPALAGAQAAAPRPGRGRPSRRSCAAGARSPSRPDGGRLVVAHDRRRTIAIVAARGASGSSTSAGSRSRSRSRRTAGSRRSRPRPGTSPAWRSSTCARGKLRERVDVGPGAVRRRVRRRRPAPGRQRRRAGGHASTSSTRTASRSSRERAIGIVPARDRRRRADGEPPGSRSTATTASCASTSTTGRVVRTTRTSARCPTASRSRPTASACSSPTAAATPSTSARSTSRTRHASTRAPRRPPAERGRVDARRPAPGRARRRPARSSSISARRAPARGTGVGGAPRGLAVAGRRAWTVDAPDRRDRPGAGMSDAATAASSSPAPAGWPRPARGRRRSAARRSPAARGAARRAEQRPNVLILMTDQERHQDRLPEDLPTPVRCWLDANGTRIDRFHASSMACSPSRACYWTGMYAPQQGIYGTFVVGTQFTMDPSIPTIGDLFKELGYRTAFFGKWHLSFPGEPPTNLEAALDTRPGQPAARATASTTRRSRRRPTSAPTTTATPTTRSGPGRRVDFLQASTRDDEQPWLCVLSLLNPHDIQFYPRGFRADFKRPDYDAKPEPSFYAEPTLGDKPTVPASASATSSRSIAGTPQRPRGRPGVLARPAQHLLRPDRRHRRDARRGDQGGDRPGRARRHGDRPHRRPRRARLRPPAAEQGHDDLRRAEPRAVHGRLPEALPARRAARRRSARRSTWCRRCSRSRASATRSSAGRGCAASASCPALEDPDAPRPARLDRSTGSTSTRSPTSAPRCRPPATSARSTTAATSSPATSRSPSSISPGAELDDEQEFELYDTWNDPYEIRNLANDPGYAGAASRTCSPGCSSASGRSTGRSRCPPTAPRAPITASPEPPSLERHRTAGIPNPWVGRVKPGQLPRSCRSSSRRRRASSTRAACRSGSTAVRPPEHAADLARFFCELGPHA